MSPQSLIDSSITEGEKLLAQLKSLYGGLARRSDDLARPEILEVRDFLTPFRIWDRANKELIAQFYSTPENLDRYAQVNQPDYQRALTDFSSMKAELLRAMMEKLDMLRSLRAQAPSLEHSETAGATDTRPQCVFIGHGRSHQWRELKDFVHGPLGLAYEEFNRAPTAGLAVSERINEMLDACTIALLVLTAEDEQADGSRHARENVIHEAGLFQGRLGSRRAILMVEDGCEPFSNVSGIVQLRFQTDRIQGCFEEVRRVLAREGAIEVAAGMGSTHKRS